MCGITGIVAEDASNFIESFTDSISHRGPDDHGYFVLDNLALGHRRLSIIDLSDNGHQPMFTSDNNYVIVFNGEIYNHLDLRKNLELKHTFKTTSDTETILIGYKEFGTSFFNMMNGIFAFSIYNKETRELLIVRDQFGVKPLYYFNDPTCLIFSSELKSLINYPKLSKELNFKALLNYLHFLWSPGEDTPLKNVKKLLPGHYISLSIDNLSSFNIRKYYEIPFDGNYSDLTETELIDELDILLEKAVRRQLLSDVPVGFFLSGGIDSSLVVAYRKKIDPNSRIDCFTIDTFQEVNSEGFSDDLKYAKLVAKHLDVNLNIVKADYSIVGDFDKVIYHLDEPQADAAPLNVLNICKEAKKMGYKVLIGGAAGDDVFSGYRRHRALKFEKYYKFIPKWFGRFIKYFFEKMNSNIPLIRRIRKGIQNIDQSKINRMTGYFCWLPLEINRSLFNDKHKNKVLNLNPDHFLKDLLKNIPDEKNDLNKMLYWELKSFLVDHNLNYTDKLGMAVGVEIRVPFLDLDLVEFSTKIPPKYKLKGMTTKYLLKKVAERYLPHEVIYRSKSGFGAPVRKWIIEDMDLMISDRLSKKNIDSKGIFDYQSVYNLIQKNKNGEIDASYAIWALLAIDSWYSQFIIVNK